MSIRDEFRLKKLWFNEVKTERFCVFQWRAPGLVYLLYRVAIAIYILTWLIIYRPHKIDSSQTSGTPEPWGAYLTSWTYVLLTIYFLYHAFIALLSYGLCRGSGLSVKSSIEQERHNHLFHELHVTGDGYRRIDDENPPEVFFETSENLPIYFCFLWILLAVVTSASIMVTLVFWLLLAQDLDTKFITTNENLQLHLFNTVLILIEHSVTAVPVRLLHVIYPIIYGFIYLFFSLFYWVDDHSRVIYPILDWGKGETAGYIILVGFVIIPLIHLMTYGFYRLKLRLFARWCL